MSVGFLGLGSLGLPVSLAVASRGHDVLGWDTSAEVRAAIAAGRSPHREEGVAEQLARSGSRLRLVPPAELVEAADLVFVAVQTPHAAGFDGTVPLPAERCDFSYAFLGEAVRMAVEAAAAARTTLTLAVISTVLPGTIEREVRPLLTDRVRLAYNPSFTAAGTAMRDFSPPSSCSSAPARPTGRQAPRSGRSTRPSTTARSSAPTWRRQS